MELPNYNPTYNQLTKSPAPSSIDPPRVTATPASSWTCRKGCSESASALLERPEQSLAQRAQGLGLRVQGLGFRVQG